jgi:hypothetical protein
MTGKAPWEDIIVSPEVRGNLPGKRQRTKAEDRVKRRMRSDCPILRRTEARRVGRPTGWEWVSRNDQAVVALAQGSGTTLVQCLVGI